MTPHTHAPPLVQVDGHRILVTVCPSCQDARATARCIAAAMSSEARGVAWSNLAAAFAIQREDGRDLRP